MLRFPCRRTTPGFVSRALKLQQSALPLWFARQYATRKYNKNDEWIEMDNDIYTFGMSDYGQSQCAEIFDVEYYDCKEVKIGDTIVDFECEKIYIPMDTPIPGTVVQINEKLKANPDLFNTSPETEGWICKIKTTAPEAQELFKNMMDEKEYRTLCKIKRAERDSYWAIAEIRMISHQNQKKQ